MKLLGPLLTLAGLIVPVKNRATYRRLIDAANKVLLRPLPLVHVRASKYRRMEVMLSFDVDWSPQCCRVTSGRGQMEEDVTTRRLCDHSLNA